MQKTTSSYRTPRARGYAALVPTLIICVVLTATSLQSSAGIYFARLSADEMHSALESRMHAHACAQVALFELSAYPEYRPHPEGDRVELGKEAACVISSVVTHDDELIVLVRGSSRGFHTVLELTLRNHPASRPPFFIQSFREI